MTYIARTAYSGRHLWLLLVFFASLLPVRAEGSQENRLRRIQIFPHAGFTRITLFFQDPPEYTLDLLAGQVRLSVRFASSPLFRRFRAYTDARISGVFCSERAGGVRVVIAVKEADFAVQALCNANPAVLSIDVGQSVKRVHQADIEPGREPILSGTEKFVRKFGLPARAVLPFEPTDVKMLKGLLGEEEATLFKQGEGLLYREEGSEAIPIFSLFLAKQNVTLRALAWYRLACALSLQERVGEALHAFRQAELLWPGYLDQAPGLLQPYAEALAESGDFPAGRKMLLRLIDRVAGTAYVAPLLNRLADMTLRHGETALAVAMYRNVVVYAPGTEAAARARMEIADQEMFSVSRGRYRLLLSRYQEIYQAPGNFLLRDEALFKVALLHALYGPAREALEASVTYDRRYPRGVFSTVMKKMREELLLLVSRELNSEKEPKALVQLALDNRDYLARCLSDGDFVKRLAHAFSSISMLSQEIPFFGYLVDRNWASPSAPFMLQRMVEDALSLGNLPLAESSARAFLTRFPGDVRAARMHEELGRIAFEAGDLKGVAVQLGFLKGAAAKAELPESYYYFGKALLAVADFRGAELSLARFTIASPAASPLLVDGYFALAGARVAAKEYPLALAAYQAGEKLATGETADQFLYKMGELYLLLKMVPQATQVWEKVVGRGGDGTWAKLAAEALSDLKWRLKVSKELP